MGFTEPVIGPATSGRTRWFSPPYKFSHYFRAATVMPANTSG
jgi:hypothetical protein